MDREAAQHFRDELRKARSLALKDSEGFDELLFVFERMGVYLEGSIGGLGHYRTALIQQASESPLAEEIPSEFPDCHAPFSILYKIVATARNDAMHEGAYARHLTRNAVELSIILEDALMEQAFLARDYMVRDPVCAFLWQPISAIRRAMLVNSFSFLPVALDGGPTVWKLISDYSVAAYLRNAQSTRERKTRLAKKLVDALEQDGIQLTDAPRCCPEDSITSVLVKSEGRPVLLTGPNGELLGILTPFDVL
jgi:CBS domain-containing protein